MGPVNARQRHNAGRSSRGYAIVAILTCRFPMSRLLSLPLRCLSPACPMPLRFDHIFMGLMGLSGVAAFVVPPQSIDHYHPQVAALFAPCAAGRTRRGVGTRPRGSADQRRPALRRRDSSRKPFASRRRCRTSRPGWKIFDAHERARCDRPGRQALHAVQRGRGPTPEARESLALRGSSLQGLREGMLRALPRRHRRADSPRGDCRRAGPACHRSGFPRPCRISNLPARRARRNSSPPPRRARRPGRGHRQRHMVVRMLTLEQVRAAKVAEGDLVVLNEPDWPANLQGQPLGKVTHIGPRPGAPLYAEIRIEPQTAPPAASRGDGRHQGVEKQG